MYEHWHDSCVNVFSLLKSNFLLNSTDIGQPSCSTMLFL